jgi:hypothetical protein
MRIIKYFEKYFIWQHTVKLCEQLHASGTGEYIFNLLRGVQDGSSVTFPGSCLCVLHFTFVLYIFLVPLVLMIAIYPTL